MGFGRQKLNVLFIAFIGSSLKYSQARHSGSKVNGKTG
ncbi:hypothetical protein P872_08355 [Rhodonellum psychrophilum GCM71 = DSM 17998]|uniref:Uncharacterized protein n=1 Tax=Rhodonellum psychrophilum GCM71 = DSM 17998 TaxID=1123057 RepID=U5BZH2_9BACT|nr:hypothetical protein P872_08355 [Rhodonellum psychrophilum GCM71 = DSM 17998]